VKIIQEIDLPNANIPAQIKSAIELDGRSVRSIAVEVGVTAQHLLDLSNGKPAGVKLSTIESLERVLGIEFDIPAELRSMSRSIDLAASKIEA
jgi:transcriptional regulator with XRE-family HTH domain